MCVHLRRWAPLLFRPLTLLVSLIATSTAGYADDAPAPEPERSEKLEFLTNQSKAATFHPVDRSDAPYLFQEAPLFRWQNPISGADGAIFVWTSGGRPMVLCKTHVNDKTRGYIHSTVSIARERFVLKRDGATQWTTPEPGVSFQTVSDAAAPANTENARLVQMRGIARRYRMLSVWGQEESGEWDLRLLPTPMMRYASPEAGVIDGALFGYAQGTNPEALVLVEAIRTEQGTEWQSAPARLSGYAIRGWFDGKQVLDTQRIQVTRDNETFRHVYQRLSPYPFKEQIR